MNIKGSISDNLISITGQLNLLNIFDWGDKDTKHIVYTGSSSCISILLNNYRDPFWDKDFINNTISFMVV